MSAPMESGSDWGCACGLMKPSQHQLAPGKFQENQNGVNLY
jgi:hypothetical protein